MRQDNLLGVLITLCGYICVWPLVAGALPMWLFMKYRPQIVLAGQKRQPLHPDRQPVPNKKEDDRIGYGVRQ